MRKLIGIGLIAGAAYFAYKTFAKKAEAKPGETALAPVSEEQFLIHVGVEENDILIQVGERYEPITAQRIEEELVKPMLGKYKTVVLVVQLAPNADRALGAALQDIADRYENVEMVYLGLQVKQAQMAIQEGYLFLPGQQPLYEEDFFMLLESWLDYDEVAIEILAIGDVSEDMLLELREMLFVATEESDTHFDIVKVTQMPARPLPKEWEV